MKTQYPNIQRIKDKVQELTPPHYERGGGDGRARNSERDAEIIDAYRSGQTMRELAEDYGVSRGRIQQIVGTGGGVLLICVSEGCTRKVMEKNKSRLCRDHRPQSKSARRLKELEVTGVTEHNKYEYDFLKRRLTK